MDALQTSSAQLGKILVTARLLTEDELKEALAEQARTGRRLGEIVVARGFVSGPALANALAEQHGGVLKTEYGIAVGLGGGVAAASARAAETTPEPEPEPVMAESPAAAAEAEVVAIFSQLLDEREVLIEQLRADIRHRDERSERTHEELVRLGAELEKAKAELAPRQTHSLAPRIWVEEREATAAKPPPALGTHLLSVPTDAGYVLIERPGEAPAAGAEVDLGEEYGGHFVVRKVALLPANGRQCAYLQRP